MAITIYSRTDRIYFKRCPIGNAKTKGQKTGRKIFVETRNENKLQKVNSKLMDMEAI